MKKATRRRAFYTLVGCLAALALTIAASLALLTPAPGAQEVTIPGTRGDICATVQLPGKLARGAAMPLAVLCCGDLAPLAADLAAQGIATVRPDFSGGGDESLASMADDVESVLQYMQSAYGTGPAALVGRGPGGQLVSLYPQRKGGVTALVLWNPGSGTPELNSALREAALPTLLGYDALHEAGQAEMMAVVESLPGGKVVLGEDDVIIKEIVEFLCKQLR